MAYNTRQQFALKKLKKHLDNVKKMLSRKRLTIDFETRCELDIKKVGAYKYSEHESCEVLMMSYSLTGRPEDTILWEKGQRPPMAFLALLKQPQYALNAFNSYFEYCIWKNVCVRKMGWLDKDITDFHDTQDKCKALALPANLEEAAKVLKVANLKNKEGTALIKLFCQPNPPAKQKKGAPKWNDATTHPDEWKRFGQYCIDDTKATISIELDLPDLSPFEQAVAWMTQQMNWRGVYVDMTAVRAATKLAEELKVKYNKEASILSGGAFEKCTQRAKVKEWFKTKGLPMKDMQGDTVNVTLRRDDLKPECRRMLELYQICGSTSTTKFATMVNYVADDGRIHELLNYHKARTGRWGGKGIQIQNLPRPVLPWWVDYCDVLDVVKKGSLPALERYAKEMEAEDKRRALEDGKTTWWKANGREILSSCLRAVLCAMFGKHFKCADYSAIEARVLLWLAGDERALDIFRRGEDIYLDMASAIYSVPMSSLTKKSDERPLGKEAVLGCFAQGTEVLTDSGWKDIIVVTKDDLVWDGVEWVSCDGVIYQGDKEVIDLWDVKLTPEHLCLTTNGWLQACQMLENAENIQFQKSTNGLTNLPCTATASVQPDVSKPYYANVLAVQDMNTSCLIWHSEKLHVVTHVPNENPVVLTMSEKVSSSQLAKLKEVFESSKHPAKVQLLSASIVEIPNSKKIGIGKMHRHWDAQNAKDFLSENRISIIPREDYLTTCTQDVQAIQNTSPITKGAESQCVNGGTTSKTLDKMFESWKDTQTVNQFLTDATITKDIHRKIAASSTTPKATKTPVAVYDILNAGLRNRFTIKTDKGAMVVHNCGYGMGHKKFRVRCDEVAGIKISAQMSEDTVKTYRAKYPLVPKLWKKLNAVAMEAVQTPGSVSEYMGIRFTVRRYGRMPILLCRFPSGHVTGYPYPRIATKQTDWGPQDSIYYQGYDSYTNKWTELDTYGGKLTENVTQGVARDLMAFGMLLLSLVDYFMIMTVHDEAVSEDDEDFGDLADFELLLCTLPKWAGTLPVTSEGWEGDRYRK